MGKSIEYYLAMDLSKTAKAISTAGAQRKELEIFSDAMNAVYFQAKNRSISESELHSFLGMPDSVIDMPNGNSVHIYKWTEYTYTNNTEQKASFLIKAGLVSGLSPEL